MTPRQREFCRHYAEGMSAKEACKASGYAEITSERNAARLLRSPQVMKRVQRLRAAKQTIVGHAHLIKARDRIMHAINFIHDEKIMLSAVRQLLSLSRAQAKMDVEQLVDEQEAAEQLQAVANPPAGNQSAVQLLDLQGQPILPSTEEKEAEEEDAADKLPTGELAFDLKLTPLKRENTKPRTPLKVIFQPMQPNQSPSQNSKIHG